MEHDWILVFGLILLVVSLSVIAAVFLSPKNAKFPMFEKDIEDDKHRRPKHNRPEPPPMPPCKQPEAVVEDRLREIINSVLELQVQLQELKVQVDKVLEKHK